MKTFDEAIDKVIPSHMRMRMLEWHNKFSKQYGRADDIMNSRVKKEIIDTATFIITQRLFQGGQMIQAEDIIADVASFGFACLEIGIAIGTEMEKGDF